MKPGDIVVLPRERNGRPQFRCGVVRCLRDGVLELDEEGGHVYVHLETFRPSQQPKVIGRMTDAGPEWALDGVALALGFHKDEEPQPDVALLAPQVAGHVARVTQYSAELGAARGPLLHGCLDFAPEHKACAVDELARRTAAKFAELRGSIERARAHEREVCCAIIGSSEPNTRAEHAIAKISERLDELPASIAGLIGDWMEATGDELAELQAQILARGRA